MGHEYRLRPQGSFSERLYRMESADLPSTQAALVNVYERGAPPFILLLNIVLAALLGWIFWGRESHTLLLGWNLTIAAVALGNGLLYHYYRRARRLHGGELDARRWAWAFILGTAINGVTWGVGGGLLYTPEAPLESAFVLLIISGVAAGVAASQMSLFAGFLSFVTPALLLPAARILFLEESIHYVVAALLLTYAAFLVYVGTVNRQNLLESIRLRFEKNRLLEELSESERYFRSLIENASDLVTLVGPDAHIRFQGPASLRVLGIDRARIEGHSIYDFIHPDDHDTFTRAWQQLRTADRESYRHILRWRDVDGHWLLLEAEGRLMDSEGAVVINSRDVTERQAMEEDLRRAKERAEAAARVKDQFLASMSHEIRTPMHAILGMADVLQGTALDADQAKYVNAFREAGEHLLGLINDILDFTRIEAGELQLNRAPFKVDELAEGVVNMLSVQAQEKGLRLSCDVDLENHHWFLGDVRRLRQIVVNLVGNAIKFTDAGGVQLHIGRAPAAPEQLHFSVTDSGCGIPPDKQAQIFEPFAQVDISSTREFGGTGLGLAISRRLVAAMGGAIWVESESGRGSTFHFTAQLPTTEAQSDGPDEASSIDGDLAPARVLVVDDSSMNRMVIQEFLKETPVVMDEATNGRKALEMATHQTYQLVLMDIQMPEMDGWAATRAIRRLEENEGRSPTPIVALTAGALDADRAHALASGCSGFLAKPVGREALLDLIRRHVGAGSAPGTP